jgi:hypothetical protein
LNALNLASTVTTAGWDTNFPVDIEEAKRRGFTPVSCSNLIKQQGGGSGQYGSGAITPNIPTKPFLPSNTGAFSSGMARITQAVNMRAQGNASASVIRVLREGEIVEVLSQAAGGWVKILATVSGGYVEGYVYGAYLSLR